MAKNTNWARARAMEILDVNDNYHQRLIDRVADYVLFHEKEQVDSLLIEARQIAANWFEKDGDPQHAAAVRRGDMDSGVVMTALAGIHHGMELATNHTQAANAIAAILTDEIADLDEAVALAVKVGARWGEVQETLRDDELQRELVDKYKWQVRDTCHRAEKAEAELADTKARLTEAERIMQGIVSASGVPDFFAFRQMVAFLAKQDTNHD